MFQHFLYLWFMLVFVDLILLDFRHSIQLNHCLLYRLFQASIHFSPPENEKQKYMIQIKQLNSYLDYIYLNHFEWNNTYFLNFFRSLWCASSPSDKLFKVCVSTCVVSLFPNQQTITLSVSSERISFPGHDGKFPCGPQTNSPS